MLLAISVLRKPMCGALYSFEYDRRRAQIFLPINVFAAFGLKDNDVFAGKPEDEICQALSSCAEHARDHLDKANVAIKACRARQNQHSVFGRL